MFFLFLLFHRKLFTELVGLHELFPETLIMALTATLTVQQSEELTRHYLKNPVVIRSTVNRPNIKLYVDEYDFKKEKVPRRGKKKLASKMSDCKEGEKLLESDIPEESNASPEPEGDYFQKSVGIVPLGSKPQGGY